MASKTKKSPMTSEELRTVESIILGVASRAPTRHIKDELYKMAEKAAGLRLEWRAWEGRSTEETRA